MTGRGPLTQALPHFQSLGRKPLASLTGLAIFIFNHCFNISCGSADSWRAGVICYLGYAWEPKLSLDLCIVLYHAFILSLLSSCHGYRVTIRG